MLKSVVTGLFRLVFARPAFEGFNKSLLYFALRGLGVLNYTSTKASGEDYFLGEVIRKYKVRNIFDVGANVGHFALIAVKNGFTGSLFCFEPHPDTYETLLKNTAEHANIKCFKFGFSNEDTTAELFDYSGSDTSEHASMYKDVISGIHKKEVKSFSIALKKLDLFFETCGETGIGFLKIDTEGNEFKVMEGAKELLSKRQIEIIQFEFNEMNVYSRVTFKDFHNLLSPTYNLYRLLPNGLLPMNNYSPLFSELYAFQNIIAIRKDLR